MNFLKNGILHDDFQNIFDGMSEDISVNGTPTKAIITNTSMNEYYDGKKVTSLTKIKRGDVIDYADSKYLVISESDTIRINKYKGIIRKCEFQIYFKVGEIQTPTGEVDYAGRPIYEQKEVHKLFPVIVDSKTFDVEFGNVINMPLGTILVSFQENEDSNLIELDQRFIKFGKAWKIVGIDKTKKGLITITAEIELLSSWDDLENEIAYEFDPGITNEEPSPEPVPNDNISCEITGADSIINNSTSTYTVKWLSNGIEVDDLIATVTSSDTNLATVTYSWNTITVTANRTNKGYVTISVVSLNGIEGSKEIQIKGLW